MDALGSITAFIALVTQKKKIEILLDSSLGRVLFCRKGTIEKCALEMFEKYDLWTASL